MKKSIVGDIINFRGLVYSPINEQGVVFLFGKITEDLNMYIEEIKSEYPDCIGRRFTGKGWERINIEFEFKSLNFKTHGHNPTECSVIVCWEHNWSDCPIEIIELKEVIKTLPNRLPERPGSTKSEKNVSLEELMTQIDDDLKLQYEKLSDFVLSLSDEIWIKTIKNGVTFYCPERVFIYLHFQKQGLRLTIFTRGEDLNNVNKIDLKRGGEKWGNILIKNEDKVDLIFPALKESFKLIVDALKRNETTGWYASLENANE